MKTLPYRPGLGMVEMLISLAITSMLLVSVAVAFHASLNSMDNNEKITLVTQNARVVLNRLMSEARQASQIDTLSPSHIAIHVPQATGGEMVTEYELANNTLWYRQTINGNKESYAVIAPEDGVVINGFAPLVAQEVDAQGNPYSAAITARLDLQVGGNQFPVTANSDLRRKMAW